MTEAEIRAQYPEIVAAIESAAAETARTNAISEERARLQGIEEIEAQIGDKQLIADAKFGEHPCDAATLALNATKKQAVQGTQFLGALNKDAAASGAQNVAGNPNGGNADEGHDDDAEFAGAMNAFKSMNGGTTK